MKTALRPLLIRSGKGACLFAEDGKSYIDACSSWWVNLHGHAHPYIAERIAAQAHTLEQVIFADCIHPPALELTNRLLPLLPGRMEKIFFTDNGSTATEAALKIALQHGYNRYGASHPKKVVCIEGSYHGDTLGALAAGGKTALNRPFWGHLYEAHTLELNSAPEQMAQILAEGGVACFIYEPIVFGTAGMVIYSSELLNSLLRLCREAGVLTIADEALTGFGRIGPLFASDTVTEKPDIICLSKSLTGGFLPFGVTACTQEVYAPFHSNERQKAFLHGHSYCGNPLGCAATLANLDLLLDSRCTEQRQRIAASHRNFASKIGHHPKLSRCETLGTLLVLEFKSHDRGYFSSLRDQLFHFCLERGVLFRPLGNVFYVLPPYCTTQEELQQIYQTLEECLTWIA